jgi:hypothetical protein
MAQQKMNKPANRGAGRMTSDRPRTQKKTVGVKKINRTRKIKRDVPSAYDMDTIVLMPVNAEKNFIYWEVTERLLNGKGKGPLKFIVKVYETDTDKEVYSFQTGERVGKHYMYCVVPLRSVFAEIGILKGRKFTGLIKSAPVLLTAVPAGAGEREVWMRRTRGLGGMVRLSDRELVRISRYNPSLQKDNKELQELFEAPYSSSAHLRKRS